MSTLDLPVVDLRDAHAPSTREAFVADLGASLEATGFVAVTGHGIPPALLSEAYAAAEALFALPEAVKRRYEQPRIGRQRGYTGFAVERAKDRAVADLKEFWQVGRRLGADHPLVASGRMPDNVFPDEELPEVGRVFGALYDRLDAFANELLDAIGQHLGLPSGHFAPIVADGNSVQRYIHYPPVGPGAPEGAVRAAAHEDINLLTVLPTSTQPGLQLVDRATGGWREVVTPPDVMICDTGDIMQRFTGGALPATTHRVVNPPGAANHARYSMPFFCHPRPDWVIEPLSGDAEPIEAGAFLTQRLRENGVL